MSSNSLSNWTQYIQERFSLVLTPLIVAGISFSGATLYAKSFLFFPTLISFIGMLLLFLLFRLMHDVKNLEKDKIANKDYPLPKGLIKVEEAKKMIELLKYGLAGFALIIWVLINSIGALCYFAILVYLISMYKDFGCPIWFKGKPVLFATLHQLINFLIAIFSVAMTTPQKAFTLKTLGFGLMLYGAFFTYEICKKLNPQSHPILATYRHFYGYRKVFELAVFQLFLTALGAISIHAEFFLIPFELIVFLCLSLLFFQSSFYKVPESAALVSLLLHVWGVFLLWL